MIITLAAIVFVGISAWGTSAYVKFLNHLKGQEEGATEGPMERLKQVVPFGNER